MSFIKLEKKLEHVKHIKLLKPIIKLLKTIMNL